MRHVIFGPYIYSEWEEVDLVLGGNESEQTVELSETKSNPFDEKNNDDQEQKDLDVPAAEKFWGLQGSRMSSADGNAYTKKYDEPFMDSYRREIEQDRLTRDGKPPTDDEMASMLRQFGYNYY